MKLDNQIQLKIPSETKKQFHQLTKENGHNSSGLIRKWINNYIKENEHAENKNR